MMTRMILSNGEPIEYTSIQRKKFENGNDIKIYLFNFLSFYYVA